ncbi:MAG: hypothetical protein DMG93_10365 [Acidobacteria bacterium]|nr:MAG: hypothetical protein DMG93_10365 [Acidobacteriota bacterium]
MISGYQSAFGGSQPGALVMANVRATGDSQWHIVFGDVQSALMTAPLRNRWAAGRSGIHAPQIRFDGRAEREEYERLFKHPARVLQDRLVRHGRTDRTGQHVIQSGGKNDQK